MNRRSLGGLRPIFKNLLPILVIDRNTALVLSPPHHDMTILNCRYKFTDEFVTLNQAWLPAPQPAFRPATVRVAWDDQSLLVSAELHDADIFNPATEFNDLGFTKGDVFEIFLRPLTQSAYYEFHVSPQNQQLQLRFPDANAIRSGKIENFFVTHRRLTSQARVDAAKQRWWVDVAIPLDLVQETGPVTPGTRWLYSFSRYDYTRGQTHPVISSSSPHAVASFHRQEEWGTVLFA